MRRAASVPSPAYGAGTETELLLLCLRPGLDGPGIARLRTLVPAVDWTRLADAALWHEVTPLVHRGLAAHAAALTPPEILDAFAVHVDTQRAAQARALNELVAITATLREASIPVLTFKGPALAADLYGDPSLRGSKDLDFLVHEDDAGRAIEVIEARGFEGRPNLSPARERAFRWHAGQQLLHRRDGVVVEPHWALFQRPLSLHFDHGPLWVRARSIDVFGHPLPTFGVEDTGAYLCLHGGKSHWVRLKWLADIALFLERHPDTDWPAILARASEGGYRRIVLLALALAEALLACDLPPACKEAVRTDAALPALVAQARRWLLEERVDTPGLRTFSGFWLRLLERKRDRAAYLWRTAFTPALVHYEMLALPDSLVLAYYPVRVVHDYALLPAWLLLKRLGVRSQKPGSEIRGQ